MMLGLQTDLTEALRLLRTQYDLYIEERSAEALPYRFHCIACGGSGSSAWECDHDDECDAAPVRAFLDAHPKVPS